MQEPKRYESADTVVIDHAELQQRMAAARAEVCGGCKRRAPRCSWCFPSDLPPPPPEAL